ncbi:hypothetical protein [Silvimonas iriomotensis]|uniref:Uncharacterized protein n=1 Tax=Silvimonas iriomotensis TaxID=449662 RepID=A0ABQ2PD84_9NEIS|nr:hypothetical protein [Silvimonas iriomotensis]GGP23115.1 hypothetical protein GCM10010970_31150 [Silvimonas iriomotensis]
MNRINPRSFAPLALWLAVSLLGGCAQGWGLRHAPPPAVTPTPTPVPEPTPPPPDPVHTLVDFYSFTRAMPAAELTRRAGELANGVQTPETMLKQAILLSQTRNPPDLARAISLAENAARTDNPLRGAAQMLGQQWNDRRRLEDQLDKQTAATKDAQRRADQIKTQLDALKNIEKDMAGDKASAPARKE